MDSLIMVAYTFSITASFPLGEIAMKSIEGVGGVEGPGERSSISKLSSADNRTGVSDVVTDTNRLRSRVATLDDVIYRPRDGSAITSSAKNDLEATSVASAEVDEGVKSIFGSASGVFERETGRVEISPMALRLREKGDCFRSTGLENLSTTATPTAALQAKVHDGETLRVHSVIVEALEKLGVLESDGKWCYSVERIRKSLMSPSPSPSFWNVELVIAAKPAIFSSVPFHDDRSKSALPERSVGSGSDVTVTSTITTSGVWCGVDGTSGGDDCTGATSGRDDGLFGDKDSVSVPTPRATLIERKENIGARPNRTQILVISTCFSVIGVFFTMALILRIRNHLRRTRSLNKRCGAVRHRQTHVTSGQRVTSSASAFSLAGAPPGEANQIEHIVGKKDGVHSMIPVVPSPGFLFRRSWSSGGQRRRRRIGPSSSSTPRPPLLRRRSELLSRLFVSERPWEREAARRYFRQLSLTCQSNALFVGETLPDEAEMTSPTATTSADVTAFSRRWENFHRLDIV